MAKGWTKVKTVNDVDTVEELPANFSEPTITIDELKRNKFLI